MKETKYNLVCNEKNIEGELKILEMALNSLFDLRFFPEEKIIYADNGNLIVEFSRFELTSSMRIIGITLNEPNKKYKVTMGEKKFDLYLSNYRSLEMDILEF
jgi:hypothetical protein